MKKFFFALSFVSFIFFFSACNTENSVEPIDNATKSLSKEGDYPYFFQNQPIYLFGDPDISRVYEDNEGIWIPSGVHPDAVGIRLDLSISNPQSIQFFVNGSQVSGTPMGTNTWYIEGYPFQSGSGYTLTVRITYSQHYGSNTCGTWTSWWDIVTPV